MDEPELDWEAATRMPAILSRIKSCASGGWTLTLDVPEIAQEQIRQLVGTENKAVYSVAMLQLSEIIEQKPRKPGRPPREEEAE